MSYLQPRRGAWKDGDVPALTQPTYVDQRFQESYPALMEFLTREWWDDKKGRDKGSVVLFCEDGMFKFCVNDKDGGMVAFLSKPTLDGLLEALEKGLQGDSLDWRMTQQGRGKKRK